MQHNPFKGLSPYREGDTLFERDSDIDLIKSRLWSAPYTLLFAGSGVGKTSFLRARLISCLKKELGLGILMPDAWTERNPIIALRALRETVESDTTAGPKLLILDQFEEVFQSAPNIPLFNGLGRELSEFVALSRRADVRVLLSVREEFLAELSGFEDFLPGLLTNYYRLEKPTLQQARSIIVNTARLGGTEVGSQIDVLLDDLRQVKGTESKNSNLIDPPYLQIVCQRLWNSEQQPGNGAKFLESYVQGQASVELERYTHEKLKGMGWRNRVYFSKAIEHLTGPHEAKKYMRLKDLARQIGLKKRTKLKSVLDPLCSDQVRILKGRNNIYGLYHDMYAPMLWRWKEKQVQLQQSLRIARWVAVSVLIMIFVVYPFIKWNRVESRLDPEEYGRFNDYNDVLDMRNSLSRIVVWRWLGDRYWRSYNKKLYTLAALKADTEAAVLYKLAANSMVTTPVASNIVSRITRPEANLLGTFEGDKSDDPIVDATLMSEEGKPSYVLIGTRTGSFRQVMFDGKVGGSSTVSVTTGCSDPLGSRDKTTPEESVDHTKTRLLSFVPGANEALIAWLCVEEGANGNNQFAIRVASFVPATGLPTNYDFVLPISSEGDAPNPSVFFQPAIPAIPPGAAIALSNMDVSFSPGNQRLAVIADGTPFVFDATSKQHWPLPLRAATKVAFINNDRLAIAQTHGQRRIGESLVKEDDAVLFCDVSQLEKPGKPTCKKSPFVLPSEAPLVWRNNGDVLVQKEAKWAWGKADGSSVPIDLPPTQTFIPQVFFEESNDRGVLLVQDKQQGRLLLFSSGAPKGHPFLVPGTEPRFGEFSSAAPYTRLLRTASRLHLEDTHVVISLDNGKYVRLWKIPRVIPRSQLPKPNPPASLTSHRYSNVDKTWTAFVQGSDLTVTETAGREWSAHHLPNPPERAVLLNATGTRALILYGEGAVYLEAREGSAEAKCYATDTTSQYVQAGFGPGPNRVTLLTRDQVVIYNPSDAWMIFECDKQGKMQAPDTKRKMGNYQWKAPVGMGTQLLNPSADETAVILYSQRWVHRIVEGSGPWPNVTSVFSDVPLDYATLELKDIHDSKVVKIHGTDSEISLAKEQAQDDSLGASAFWMFWSTFWSSPRNLTLCEKQTGFGATGLEITPQGAREKPFSGDWRALMCRIETRTNRQTGAGNE